MNKEFCEKAQKVFEWWESIDAPKALVGLAKLLGIRVLLDQAGQPVRVLEFLSYIFHFRLTPPFAYFADNPLDMRLDEVTDCDHGLMVT